VEKIFGTGGVMASFLIVACNRCGRFLLAKTGQKTRTCPYCGSKVILDKAKKIASAVNAYEASELLRRLKRNSFQK
jgi:DNA-directed RNA polymerase subunit RPC12/RpoP